VYFRFINPAILSPDSYLIASEVSPARRQNLVRIAKVLQLVASNQQYDKADSLAVLNSQLGDLSKQLYDYFEEVTKIVAPKKGSSKKPSLSITPEVLFSLQTLMVEFLCDVSLVSTDIESAQNLNSEELILPSKEKEEDKAPNPASPASPVKLISTPLKIKTKTTEKAAKSSSKKKSAPKVLGSSPLVDILCVLGSPPEEVDLGPPEDNAPVKFVLM